MKVSKIIKSVLFTALIIISIVFTYLYFSTSDLRAEKYMEDNQVEKARRLLNEMGKAHQIENWDSITSYQVDFKEEFFGQFGKMTSPFADAVTFLTMDYNTKSADAKMEFTSGKDKGTVWGIENGKTYIKSPFGQAEFIDSKNVKFWIPTYQYFVEFPWRIQEATAVSYLGSDELKGVKAEKILASWGSIAPQKDIDQYVIWIHAESKRILKIEYTIREMHSFLTGAAYFENYKEFEGVLIATEFPVESNLVSDGFLHKMSVVNFEKVPDTMESLPIQ